MLRFKINAFMYVFKRPISQRSIGIGLWLYIWEGMSLFVVVKLILFIILSFFYNKY